MTQTPEGLSASGLLQAYDPEAFRQLGHRIVDQLANYLGGTLASEGPVLVPQDPEELLGEVPGLDARAADGGELEHWLDEVLRHSNHVHHPSFLGHQVSVPLPASVLVEMVSALLSNGMAIWEMGQLHTVMERRVIEWLAGAVGFAPGADGILTHGGSLGNLTALLAARQAKAGYDVWTEGQREPMAVLVSDQAHYCVARAVQCMGWGAEGAAAVPTDARFRLRPEALEGIWKRCQDEGRRVLAVVASSCSTAAGSFDPLHELADFCAEHDLWLHVDGAHGASLALSERYRGPIQGIERADSVVWDLHKLLALPALNTAVLFRDGARSYEPFAQEASYLFEDATRQEWFQIGRRTLECTKRGLSVTAYAVMRALGTDLFASNVERLVSQAHALADRLEAADDFELATYPDANILCFRHLPKDGRDLDAHQALVRRKLIESGRAYITQARLRDALWLRVTVQNPWSGDAQMEGLMDELRRVAAS